MENLDNSAWRISPDHGHFALRNDAFCEGLANYFKEKTIYRKPLIKEGLFVGIFTAKLRCLYNLIIRPSMKTLLKTSLVSTVTILALAVGLSAKVVGSGNVTTETRNVTGYHGLELLTIGDVTVTQGDTEGLVIEAEDNIIPLIETKVEDGALRIGFKAHEEIHTTKKVLIKLSVKTLDAIVIKGSGDVVSKALKADQFAIKILGSGDIAVDRLETGAVSVAIDGSGNVKLAGKAVSQTISVHGSGDYDAAGLKTGAATVEAAGSGDCELAASETLAINVSGSGDVSYHGKPTVTKHVSGSGDVISLGAEK